MPRGVLAVGVWIAAAILCLAAQDGEWAAYGRDPGGERFSPLDGIRRDNVGSLKVAWTYRTGDAYAPKVGRATAHEATPLYVDGTLFLSTPLGRVIALDPVTGKERWVFNWKAPRDMGWGDYASRGVAFWRRGNQRRIFVATIDAHLIALDASSGKPFYSFGDVGSVDLRKGLRVPPTGFADYAVTSPPAVVGDAVIVGSAVADGTDKPHPSGEVRAFHALTGKLLWTWDPVPQAPDALGADTWKSGTAGPRRRRQRVVGHRRRRRAQPGLHSYEQPQSRLLRRRAPGRQPLCQLGRGAARGYRPEGLALPDHPPRPVGLRRGVAAHPVRLAQGRAHGYQRLPLPRRAASCTCSIARAVSPSSRLKNVPCRRAMSPGETSSPTQPFPAAPAPLARTRLTADEAWGATTADREWCRRTIAALRSDGLFTPPSLQGSLVVPGNIGGVAWGGMAHDRVNDLLIMSVNDLAAEVRLVSRDNEAAERSAGRLSGEFEFHPQRGTAYGVVRRFLLAPATKLPCTPPPWGTLVAVRAATGELAWRVPFGQLPWAGKFPDAASWGSIVLGGPIATAGGLVFAAGTLDPSIYAFDVSTGTQLWKGTLPTSARATPMTYRGRDGRQFVVVSAGGHAVEGGMPLGDYVVAFALPAAPR